MKRFAVIAAPFALAACGDPAVPSSPDPAPPPVVAPAAQPVAFTCADGSALEVSYPDRDTAVIVRDGQSVTLTSAISASGARYTGSGWQWWSRGAAEGALAPLAEGEEIASAEGVICTSGPLEEG